MTRVLKQAAIVCALGASWCIATPSAHAVDLFSVWVQGHGSVLTGGDSPYFDAQNPAAGYGAELGVQVLMLQVYLDFSIMDQVTTVDESSGRVHWNHIGFGPRIEAPIPGENMNAYVAGHVNFLNADYVEDQITVQNQGWQFRAGGGVELGPGNIVWFGADVYLGYALFDEPMFTFEARGFVRFRLSTGKDDEEPEIEQAPTSNGTSTSPPPAPPAAVPSSNNPGQ